MRGGDRGARKVGGKEGGGGGKKGGKERGGGRGEGGEDRGGGGGTWGGARHIRRGREGVRSSLPPVIFL